MSLFVEDEVDWSDGSLEPAAPAGAGAASENLSPVWHTYEDVERSNLYESAEPDPIDLPFGVQLPLDAFEGRSRDAKVVSRAQRARIGIHFNRREPTKSDYSNFVLYQANQKTYEAMFLKAFVAHALHPDQLLQCLGRGEAGSGELQGYLRTVSNNVNQIANKIIWNAHSRAVNFLTNDGKESAHFWDIRRFDSNLFTDFCPEGTYPVIQKMRESWHRAFNPPPMVRYTTKDYPISKHCSPVEEIDEVAATLFNDKSFSKTLATGHVVRPRSTMRKSSSRNLPSAAARAKRSIAPRDGWLGDFNPSITQHRNSPSLLHESKCFTAITTPDAHGTQGLHSVLGVDRELICHHVRGSTLSSEDLGAGYDGLPEAAASPVFLSEPFGSGMGSEGSTQLGQFINRLGADVLLQDMHLGADVEVNADQRAAPTAWRNKLIKDHKRRLAQMRSLSRTRRQGPLDDVLLDLKAIIERALARGIRPVASQEQIDHALSVQRRNRQLAALREQEVEVRRDEPSTAADRSLKDLRRMPLNHRVLFQNQGSSTSNEPPLETYNSSKRQRNNSNLRKDKDAAHVPQAPTDAPNPSIDVLPRGQRAKAKPKRQGSLTHTSRKKQKTRTDQERSTDQAGYQQPRSSIKLSTFADTFASSLPHPSGSNTLEPHQKLPPDAYFEPVYNGENPAWRCGIKHAMGHYYNAGDRRNCPGCFTSVNENPRLKWMDFYLPSYTHYHQPTPDIIWKPSKQLVKERRSKHLSHNSIAKEAYWTAVGAGASEDEARQKGVEAVLEHLRPKPPREPTPQPTPEPSPEPVDLGPHPSGSSTMEHGQDLPQCAYFEKQEKYEELAWRCEVNHALGRYYLAGDKRTCPGCGSNKSGVAKHTEMDFYMPPSAVVRQEAPGLVEWHPRKPYKCKGGEKTKKAKVLSHNQIASKSYWDAVEAGKKHADALEVAIKETDAYLDAKNEAMIQKRVKALENHTSEEFRSSTSSSSASVGSGSHSARSHELDKEDAAEHGLRRNCDGRMLISFVPRKRGSEEFSDSEDDEVPKSEAELETGMRNPEVVYPSSEDEPTSDSDSE